MNSGDVKSPVPYRLLRHAKMDKVGREFIEEPFETELLSERVIVKIRDANCKVICAWLPIILILLPDEDVVFFV